jgi:hypothetical protein
MMPGSLSGREALPETASLPVGAYHARPADMHQQFRVDRRHSGQRYGHRLLTGAFYEWGVTRSELRRMLIPRWWGEAGVADVRYGYTST